MKCGTVRVPSWFGHEMRKRPQGWKYTRSYDGEETVYRRSHGTYTLFIDDEELLKIERPLKEAILMHYKEEGLK